MRMRYDNTNNNKALEIRSLFACTFNERICLGMELGKPGKGQLVWCFYLFIYPGMQSRDNVDGAVATLEAKALVRISR